MEEPIASQKVAETEALKEEEEALPVSHQRLLESGLKQAEKIFLKIIPIKYFIALHSVLVVAVVVETSWLQPRPQGKVERRRQRSRSITCIWYGI